MRDTSSTFSPPTIRIVRNAVACLICGDVIESETTHDMVWCSCGNIAVDGGKDYFKRSCKNFGFGKPTFVDLSQVE